MFLFPWLDWGIDISDFEKINFLGHGAFLGIPSPWAGCFFFLQQRHLRHWAENSQKVWYNKIFFHTTLFENFLPNGVSAVDVQNQPAQRLGTPQNHHTAQKIDFFKVRDIDTPIQPRKKKHQTNVSSALKTF